MPLRPVMAAHIETDQAGGFIAAHSLTNTDITRRSQHYETPDELIADFARYSYRGYELLLYQADHDMRYLIPALERLIANGYSVTFTLDGRQRIIYAKIGMAKHRWYIRDCSAMLPLDIVELRNLADLGDDAPVEAVILKAYRHFAETLKDTFGVRPAITIGTTAINAWATTLPEHHVFYRQRPEVEAIAREGYFGGLVWLHSQQEQTDCSYIDCNAMYAHAMRQGVPVMSPTLTDHYYPDRPGIYNCRVFCPSAVAFAFVPYRDPYYYNISYPRDTWYDAVLCSSTIDLARELGYNVEIIDGYVFEKLDNPFDSFINKCQELENQYKTAGSAGVIKALRNSVNGKFGMRTTGKEYYLTAEPDEDMTPVLAWDDGEIIDNLYYREVDIERPYMQPVWAMWITATARNMLTRAVYALGPANCTYGDTDAIVVAAPALAAAPLPIGTQYGEWKIKEHFTTFRAMGRKLYAGQTHDGAWVIIAAGIKRGVLTPEDMAQVLPNGPGVLTAPYTEERRAIHTTGGRAHSTATVKQITVPDLDPWWAGKDYTLNPRRE